MTDYDAKEGDTPSTDRPNIVVVVAPHLMASVADSSGRHDVETPAIDDLHSSGTTFDRAYATASIREPSLASVLSGRMPHDLPVKHNRMAVPGARRPATLGRLFRDAGYDPAFVGEWAFPVDDAGRSTELADHGFEDLGSPDNPANAAQEFLSRDRSDPFLLVVSIDRLARIGAWMRGSPLIRGDDLHAPPADCPPLTDNFEIPTGEPTAIRPFLAERPLVSGGMLDASRDDWRQYRYAYDRLVEAFDATLGRLVDELAADGSLDNTVLAVTGLHGEGCGAHKLPLMVFLYEEIVRVPLVVHYPPETDSGNSSNRLVSTGLDLLPTLCDYAGVNQPDGLQGRSLRPLAAGDEVDVWRSHVVSQTFIPFEGRAIRSDRYKYVVYGRGENREQLFDLAADPGEMVDLADNPDHRKALDAHRRHLLEWCKDTDDTFDGDVDVGLPTVPGYSYAEVKEFYGGFP